VIRLTNLADYAVVVMTAAARTPGVRLSAATVADATGIPVPTVAKLLGTLARGELLVASRGVMGGFTLVHDPAAISVAAIVEAVDGPIALTNCLAGDAHDCAIEGRCSVRGHWAPINRAVRDALAAVTLAELVKLPAAKPVRHEVMA
jgi:FeS assembly SUF system regulator